MDGWPQQRRHQVKGGLLLDVVVSEAAATVQLLTGKDKALLVRGDALLVLDLGLDIVNGVRTLNPRVTYACMEYVCIMLRPKSVF
uniref:Uncharacterized protein n=1 Tax=Triticum urartu TaxID=4572 RepID=A0A8R7R6K0_TRIUA